ncbi:MAG: hypothetical protein Q4B84_04825 [Clostridia bacterium]|nr:hypothetical protein [Clostridia bacterium]
MKRIFVILALIISFVFFFTNVRGKSQINFDDIYNSQLESSGAKKIAESLLKETLGSLNKLGIDKFDFKKVSKFSIIDFFKEALDISKESFFLPFNSLISVFAIVFLAFFSRFLNTQNKELSKTSIAVCTLSLCFSVIIPISKCINSALLIIKTASSFVLCLAPVMATITIASGKPLMASVYQTSILIFGQVISFIAVNFLAPLLNIILGIAIISTISQQIDLRKLCKEICGGIKFILKTLSSVFVGLVTIQNVIAVSSDNAVTNIAKFTVDSCVPIVGTTLSEAVLAVQSCVRLLKSSVGTFGIIAGVFIFLPILIKCVSWILFLKLGVGISKMFGINKIVSLLEIAINVVSILLAFLVCSIVVLIISIGILILIGG